MSQPHNWTIVGSNPFADDLRRVAPFVSTDAPISIATESGDISHESFAVGPATLLSKAERFIPYYAAFEAIEFVRDALVSGEAGMVYGCFTSFRIPRGATPEELMLGALLPAVSVTLDLLPKRVIRVFAQRSSLFADGDAWFVTLKLEDETIVSIEAMASNDEPTGRELLVEVTASERVLRAEPMKQSVVVEPLGKAPQAYGWWEDLNERYLLLVTKRAGEPHNNAGSRLRAVWDALQESAQSGQPVVTN
jgi:hypothetical protein